MGFILEPADELDQRHHLGITLVDEPFDLAAHSHVFAIEHLRVEIAPDIAEIIDALNHVSLQVGRGGDFDVNANPRGTSWCQVRRSRRFCLGGIV